MVSLYIAGYAMQDPYVLDVLYTHMYIYIYTHDMI